MATCIGMGSLWGCVNAKSSLSAVLLRRSCRSLCHLHHLCLKQTRSVPVPCPKLWSLWAEIGGILLKMCFCSLTAVWGPLSWLSPSHCSWAATRSDRPVEVLVVRVSSHIRLQKGRPSRHGTAANKKTEAVKISLKPKWKEEMVLLRPLNCRLWLIFLEPRLELISFTNIYWTLGFKRWIGNETPAFLWLMYNLAIIVQEKKNIISNYLDHDFKLFKCHSCKAWLLIAIRAPLACLLLYFSSSVKLYVNH